MSTTIARLILLLMCNSSSWVQAKSNKGNNKSTIIGRIEKQFQRSLQSKLCSCSPTIFNIHVSFHSDPCKTDDLDDNTGIRGTLCLVGQTEASTGGDNSGMEVETTATPTTSSTVITTDNASKIPTFSPTFNPTPQTSTASSVITTQDPFLPPAGSMPIAQRTESLPTYAPSTPFPTYGTYTPTIDGTYAPSPNQGHNVASIIHQVKKLNTPSNSYTYAPSTPFPTFDTDSPTAPAPSAPSTFYPTVDKTYGPTAREGHGVASLIKRVKKLDTPSSSYTYAPSTSFPTFDTNAPTDVNIVKGQGSQEHKRRLLKVINLDELEKVAKDDKEPNSSAAQDSADALSSIVEAWRSIPPNDEFFIRFPEWKDQQEYIYQMRQNNVVSHESNQQPRMLQASIAVPNQLISAQFLEIDTSPDMTIINQDDSYINLTNFQEEDVILSYTSISATLDPTLSLEDQIDSVPGGAILVLIGQDENGELVRNRLMWTYTMKCGEEVETVNDGDEFGWALFSDLEPAREEFCPAIATTPAPSPSPTGFSMDFNTMDYNRLLKYFDLEGGDSQGRSGRNHKSRRNRMSKTGEMNSSASDVTKDFGRIIMQNQMNPNNDDNTVGREMKRLRKRITV